MVNETRGFKTVYYILCVLAAAILTFWCTYEYHLDHDVTEIILQKFHNTPNDILPSITLCDTNPFPEYTTWLDDGKKALIQRYGSLINGYKNKFIVGVSLFYLTLISQTNELEN